MSKCTYKLKSLAVSLSLLFFPIRSLSLLSWALASIRWLPLSPVLALQVCLTTCLALSGNAIHTPASLCFLPRSFALVNFPSSLCLFMTYIPSRSYFHRSVQCNWPRWQSVWKSSLLFLCLCLAAYCLLLASAAKPQPKVVTVRDIQGNEWQGPKHRITSMQDKASHKAEERTNEAQALT